MLSWLSIPVLALSLCHAAGLPVGSPAPTVAARNQDGREIRLAEHRGKWVLLYFYPKDDTSGCTKQACDLRDAYEDFQKAGVVVYGVSRQGAESHRAFRAKHRLPFDLLVDEDGRIGDAFGISTMPLIGFHHRQSVLIDPKGKVARFLDDVDPATHASEILKAVKK